MPTPNNKALKFILRAVKLILLGLILLALIAFIFWFVIRKDNPAVLNKIKRHATENWNANLTLKGYELKLKSPFPNLELHLNNVSYGMLDTTKHQVLKANKAIVQFDPWDLYRNQKKENHLELDSAWIMIHHDSLDNNNLQFSDGKKETSTTPANFDFANVINLKANYIDFKNIDEFRDVWQGFQLTNATILPGYNSRKELTIQLNSKAHFDGLVFKSKDGPFLKNTNGDLQLNLGWDKKKGLIRMDDAHLITSQDDFKFSGLITQGETDKIRLDIIDDDIILAELLPKLSDKARADLGKIKIDRPIKGHFSLDNLLVPNRNGAVNIDFETLGANIKYGEASISNAKLKGSYSNDCDGDGLGDPITSCIVIEQLDGDIFGRLPTKLNGSISNLREPMVDMNGKMDVDLPRLNPLLTTKQKMNFNNGNAFVNFNYTGDLKKIITDPFNDEFTEMKGDVAFNDIVIKTGDDGLLLPALTGHMTFSESKSTLQDLSLNWMGSNILLKGKIGNLPKFLFYREEALQSDLDIHFDELDLNKFQTANNKEFKLSEALLNQQIRALAFNINGDIDLKIDKLIYDTLFATDLTTHFELFTPKANGQLDSTLIRMDKLTGKLFDEDVFELDLKILHEPETFVDLDISMPNVTKTTNRFLSNMEIENGNTELSLNLKTPLLAAFDKALLLHSAKYQGFVKLDNINLKPKATSFPLKDISGVVNINTEAFLIENISFLYKDSPFTVNGVVEDFPIYNADKVSRGKSNLSIKGNFFNARHEPPTDSKINQTFSPSEIFKSLDTIFQLTSGSVEIELDSILTNGHTIEPFYMQAQLLANQHHQEEHLLLVDSVRLGFRDQNYVQGNLQISDTADPKVKAKFEANMALRRLGDLLPSEYIDLKDGNFEMQVDYQSVLHDTLSAKHYLLAAEINGQAKMSNGNIYYNYRDFTFDAIDGLFVFDENTLQIPSISMNVNNNDLQASGESVDFFPFFILPNQKASIDLSIASNQFDIGKFSTPQKIKTHATGEKGLKVKTKKNPTSVAIKQTLGYIDLLLAQGTIKMDTKIKDVIYRKFDAADFTGLVVVKPDTVLLSDVKMDVAKGTFGIDGMISGIANHQPSVSVDIKMRDNDLQQLLTQFENFDQNQFTNENIKGNITADVNFTSDITEDYAFKSESMGGDMYFQLAGGNIKDIEALANQKGFLAKGRKLEDIKLDTLDFRASLKGNELWVEQTRVNSSPGNFHVEGVYDLEEKQNSRMLLTVPLRNLFKRYNSLEEMEKNQYKGKGIPILIESRYKKGKLKFKWKLFVNKKKRGYSNDY